MFEDNGLQMGRINFGGIIKVVCLAYLPDIQVGEYALVHVGFAISKVDEEVARDTLRTFEELGMLEAGLDELQESEFERAASADDPLGSALGPLRRGVKP